MGMDTITTGECIGWEKKKTNIYGQVEKKTVGETCKRPEESGSWELKKKSFRKKKMVNSDQCCQVREQEVKYEQANKNAGRGRENRKVNLDWTHQDTADDPAGCSYSKLTGAEAKTAGWVLWEGRIVARWSFFSPSELLRNSFCCLKKGEIWGCL